MTRFKPLRITRRFLEAVVAKVHPIPQDMPVAPGWVWQGDGAERNLTVAGYRILRLLNGEDTQELDSEGDFLKNMRTVCELRRRLRNDCDEATQHALTQAMLACAEAQTVMVHLAAEQVRHEETKAEREALQGALLSIQRVMAADPRDWSIVERDAWLYAVLLGWDEALPEVATRHGWTSRVLTIIRRYRSIIESTMRKNP